VTIFFFKICCPLSNPLLQIKMEKTYYLQDHSAKSTWSLWIFTWPFGKFTWTLCKSKIYMYCGVTSSPMLVLIICCICLVLSAIKIPHTPDGYKGHLSIPLDIILDCSQGLHNGSWLKKACSSLNVRLSQSCWDFTLDVTQGHPLRHEVNFLLELLVTECNENNSHWPFAHAQCKLSSVAYMPLAQVLNSLPN